MADDDDDPALHEMRAAWRSLPDEDPPERGLAELMAAARVRAEEMAAARTPWWKRAVAALMRPPVLALASVLVLLGGLFVVTSSHKGVSPEPTPIEAPAAPAAAASPAPSPAMGSAALALPGAQAAPASGAVDTLAPAAGLGEPASSAPARDAPPRVAPKKVVAHHSAEKALPDEDEKPSPPPPPPPAALEQSPAAAPPPEPTVPAPAPATAPAGTDGGADNAADEEEKVGGGHTRGPVQKNAKPQANALDSELAKCRAAAARGDCASVQAIAKQIRARDAAYYADRVAADAAIAGCLSQLAK